MTFLRLQVRAHIRIQSPWKQWPQWRRTKLMLPASEQMEHVSCCCSCVSWDSCILYELLQLREKKFIMFVFDNVSWKVVIKSRSRWTHSIVIVKFSICYHLFNLIRLCHGASLVCPNDPVPPVTRMCALCCAEDWRCRFWLTPHFKFFYSSFLKK